MPFKKIITILYSIAFSAFTDTFPCDKIPFYPWVYKYSFVQMNRITLTLNMPLTFYFLVSMQVSREICGVWGVAYGKKMKADTRVVRMKEPFLLLQ